MRFQPPTMSSGWKKVGMVWSSSRRRTGALRNHSSLKALTVSLLSRPLGTNGGAVASTPAE